MKSTNDEIEKRVDAVAEMLAGGFRFGEIKRRLREQFGPLSSRQIQRHLARAKRQMLAACERPRRELLAEAVEFYSSVLRDSKAPFGSKISARERLDAIFGLDEVEVNDGPAVIERELQWSEALEKVYGDDARYGHHDDPPPSQNGNGAP